MMISNLNLAKLPECVCEMRYIDSALLTPCAEYQQKGGGDFCQLFGIRCQRTESQLP